MQCGHYLRSCGIFFWKALQVGFFDPKTQRFRRQASPFAINGVSDFVVIIDGRVIGLEFKTKIGRQSDSQKSFEEKLRKAGGEYFIIRSLDELKHLQLK